MYIVAATKIWLCTYFEWNCGCVCSPENTIQYNTIQFAYLPCASWSTAFPLNGFSNFVINSPCSHHPQGSLKHMYIPVFSKLFFILNSISVFCAFDVEFDKSRAYACSTNIKDKNRLWQLSGQFLEWMTLVLKNIGGKKKPSSKVAGSFMKNSSFFYVFEITRTNNVDGFWNDWKSNPNLRFLSKSNTHPTLDAGGSTLWFSGHVSMMDWCQLGLPWQNKQHGDAVLQDASGKQAYTPNPPQYPDLWLPNLKLCFGSALETTHIWCTKLQHHWTCN